MAGRLCFRLPGTLTASGYSCKRKRWVTALADQDRLRWRPPGLPWRAETILPDRNRCRQVSGTGHLKSPRPRHPGPSCALPLILIRRKWGSKQLRSVRAVRFRPERSFPGPACARTSSGSTVKDASAFTPLRCGDHGLVQPLPVAGIRSSTGSSSAGSSSAGLGLMARPGRRRRVGWVRPGSWVRARRTFRAGGERIQRPSRIA